MYKKAAQMGLRFASTKGALTTEDLFTLNLTDLDRIAVKLNAELEKSPRVSFIADVTPDNSVLELKFNIVKDVIATKLEEKQSREANKTKLARKAKIEELIAKKEDAGLENLSIEELKKLRDNL